MKMIIEELDTFEKVGFTILGIILILVIYSGLHYIPPKYEYIDLDNNKGIAKNCSYSFENAFSGGQGSPVCELEDGTILQVKQYKEVVLNENIN
ncbi:MAG: hypothetical protein IKO78_02525 [Bacilli bacterium]|nr:hypothetical protein [Bacilli bacterium]